MRQLGVRSQGFADDSSHIRPVGTSRRDLECESTELSTGINQTAEGNRLRSATQSARGDSFERKAGSCTDDLRQILEQILHSHGALHGKRSTALTGLATLA